MNQDISITHDADSNTTVISKVIVEESYSGLMHDAWTLLCQCLHWQIGLTPKNWRISKQLLPKLRVFRPFSLDSSVTERQNIMYGYDLDWCDSEESEIRIELICDGVPV